MDVITSDTFRKQANKLDKNERQILQKKIRNIIDGKIKGKPLKYDRKGTWELYMGSKRLYFKIENNVLYLLEHSHKKEQ